MTAGEHWFDRLTQGITRRQAIKGAAVAGAGLTLPLVRTAPAVGREPRATAAFDSTSCRKGCYWTVHQHTASRLDGCANKGGVVGGLTSMLLWGLTPIVSIPLGAMAANRRYQTCSDRALLIERYDMDNCLEPYCNHFDPRQKGGPCDDCSANCCACEAVSSGYICCLFACDDPGFSCCPKS